MAGPMRAEVGRAGKNVYSKSSGSIMGLYWLDRCRQRLVMLENNLFLVDSRCLSMVGVFVVFIPPHVDPPGSRQQLVLQGFTRFCEKGSDSCPRPAIRREASGRTEICRHSGAPRSPASQTPLVVYTRLIQRHPDTINPNPHQ